MSSVHRYSQSDFREFFGWDGPFPIQVDGKPPEPPIMVYARHHQSSGAACAVFYVPPPFACVEICRHIVESRNWWMNFLTIMKAVAHGPGEPPRPLTDTTFTGRLAIYVDGRIAPVDVATLQAIAKSIDVNLEVRDLGYAEERDRTERVHAFICHDSKDKDLIARPLASALSLLCRVWYDEYSLKVGDSLRESIDKGLKECRRCILILTPNFLANGRWPKTEFTSIFTREIVEEKRLVLPVWAGVTHKEVFDYSSVLADRVAAIWTGDAEQLAAKLKERILSD